MPRPVCHEPFVAQEKAAVIHRLVGLIALLAVLALGCTPPPKPVADVEGEVSYDGEIVTSGIISFLPLEGTGPSGGGAIRDGKYRIYPEVGLPPGKYRIEIRWPKPTGERLKEVPYGHSPIVVAEGLPEKYHTGSTLTAEVEAGKNTVDFRLEK